MKESQSLFRKKSFQEILKRVSNSSSSHGGQKLRESERNFARISNPLFQTRSLHFVISIRAVIRLVYPAGRGIVVPVVLVLFSRGRARRDGRGRERASVQPVRRVTPKSFSSRYDSLLYALDYIWTTQCIVLWNARRRIWDRYNEARAHALSCLPSRALMHRQGRIDPL